jgi:hypothetical protein
VLSNEREITTPATVNNKVMLPSNCCQDFIQLSFEIVPTISQQIRQYSNNDIYSLYYKVFAIYKALYVIVNMPEKACRKHFLRYLYMATGGTF